MTRKERVVLKKYQREEMRELARKGWSTLQLGGRYKVSKSTIVNICQGIPLLGKTHMRKNYKDILKKVESSSIKRHWYTDKHDRALIKELNKKGLTQQEIAEKVGCSTSTVWYHVNPRGKARVKDYKKRYYNEKLQTQGKAFDYPAWYVLVGFIVFLLVVVMSLSGCTFIAKELIK